MVTAASCPSGEKRTQQPLSREEWADIYEQTHELVRQTLRRYLFKKEEIEEALQEVYLGVGRNSHQLRDQTNLHAWIARIAVNNALLIRRREGNRKKHVTYGDNDSFPEPPDRHCMAEERDVPELTSIVRDALQAIPDISRLRLVQRYREDMPSKLIAQIDDRGNFLLFPDSVRNVDLQMHRAKERLRTELENRGFTKDAL